MSVKATHPDYDKYIDTWVMIEDACEGARAVKEKKRLYLPSPVSVAKETNETKERYNSYLKRAVYTNFCSRTLSGLKGAAFKKEPVIELSPGLEYLLEDANGSGVGLVQLAKDSLSELLKKGRLGFLVDYPTIDGNPSEEDLQRMNVKANVCLYSTECIINWRTASIAGNTVLSLLVLKESYNASDDEFEEKREEQYRVLRLDSAGYSVQLYREIDEEYRPVADPYYPRNARGSTFNRIPFFFAGSTNNDYTIDVPPFEALAELNIAHYRNSADLEENSFVHGQLTLGVTSSLTPEQFKQANPNGIQVGARAGHYLGASGGFHSVQANPSSLTKEIMADKVEQMRMIGAKIVWDTAGNQTATAAAIEHSSEHSLLSDIANNLSEVLTSCFAVVGEFMGVSGESFIEINSDYTEYAADPQLMASVVDLYDRELIDMGSVRDYSRKIGLVGKSDQEIDEAIANPDA